MTATQAPPQAEGGLARRDSFAGTLRAEWTKFRTVRGWVIDGATPSGDLKTVKKWLGYGPPSSMLDLLHWASDRWYNFTGVLQSSSLSYYWSTVFGGFAHTENTSDVPADRAFLQSSTALQPWPN